MEQQVSVTILADGQTTPEETTTPPRKAKWYDTFVYIADPAVRIQVEVEGKGGFR